LILVAGDAFFRAELRGCGADVPRPVAAMASKRELKPRSAIIAASSRDIVGRSQDRLVRDSPAASVKCPARIMADRKKEELW
jgi:hypothetical protein